ncbi:putative membrane protein [Asticcacaulis biprosthecium C19]|uniref:Putative membrane protein n=1 Tax=Asticcacaulis biprosthecium C19 TaxID=715226 RepID=F4QIA3_9CAUL|nr:hypothetical protein [Asticcacaulis biprosthecium]EGF91741.1 putative membrane protein [Asticcacaulis biprosthecium C19]
MKITVLYALWLVWIYGGYIAVVGCCAWAFRSGGVTERLGAAIIGIGWMVTGMLAQRGQGPGADIVAIDVTVLILLVALVLKSRRLWTFFAAACMLNAVFAHIAHQVTAFGIYSYSTAAGFWGGWALLACLAGGIIGHQRAEKRRLS